jgi:hypothetical protein
MSEIMTKTMTHAVIDGNRRHEIHLKYLNLIANLPLKQRLLTTVAWVRF